MKKIFLFAILSIILLSFSGREITWVAIGDSITYLNDHPDETGNRITKGYMSRITDKHPNIHFVNKGYNGWTAVRIASEIEKLGIQKADLYTVFLGTNDWWGGKPLGSFSDYQNNTGATTVYGAFRIIINKLRSLNPDAKIILITPMQRVDFVYINNYKNNAFGSYKAKNGQQLEDFANAIVDIAVYEKLQVLDLYHTKGLDHPKLVKFKWLKDPATGTYKKFKYPDFIDVPFDPAKDEYPYPEKSIDMTYDGLHPSDKGYKKISKGLYKLINN